MFLTLSSPLCAAARSTLDRGPQSSLACKWGLASYEARGCGCPHVTRLTRSDLNIAPTAPRWTAEARARGAAGRAGIEKKCPKRNTEHDHCTCSFCVTAWSLEIATRNAQEGIGGGPECRPQGPRESDRPGLQTARDGTPDCG